MDKADGKSENGRRHRHLAAFFMMVTLVPASAAPGQSSPAPAQSRPVQSPPSQTQSRPVTQSQPATQSRPGQTQSAPVSGAPPASPADEWVIDGAPVTELLPRDAIASVDQPVMVSAAAGDAFMRDEETVLGVFDGTQARAYSTWHLDRHEIVNDRLGETPIAATW